MLFVWQKIFRLKTHKAWIKRFDVADKNFEFFQMLQLANDGKYTNVSIPSETRTSANR